MILSICPAGTALVPYKHPPVGQPIRYIGRAFDPKTKGWPANQEPHKIDTDKERPELITKLRRRAMSGDVFPHDAQTAVALGVPFLPIEWVDGEWRRVDRSAATTDPKRSRAAGGND